jgi:hypothetical protein
MWLMPGWYQTSKPVQFKAIEEFATNRIKKNAFQLEDYLKGSNEELGKGEMTIARVFGFTEGDI